jgi:hypothetical protein
VALTRDEIKAKRCVRQRIAVEVPELGGTIYVAKMTARDRDELEYMVNAGRPGGMNTRNIRARFLTLVCVNEDGSRMFDESDAEWLGDLDTDTVQLITDAGFKLNGIGRDALEEATKN